MTFAVKEVTDHITQSQRSRGNPFPHTGIPGSQTNRPSCVESIREFETLPDPRLAAEAAGLTYRTDDIPGISRRHRGKGFAYFHPDGKIVKDGKVLARIRQLAIPPAWTDVWISPDANGHLAATGRDARLRKQYRYNPEFVEMRDAAKYERLVAFAKRLPRLRRILARHMALEGLPREKVLATVVHLLEISCSRIGNESYVKDNRSYGLSTLRNRHVRVNGSELKFLFPGKGGKTWRFSVNSKRVAKVIRACQELPGQHLFEYRDSDGAVGKIASGDVNAYLHETLGEGVTAKDFRTWAGTVVAALTLHAFGSQKKQPASKDVREALACAAGRLANTVTVCRKCYVHPDVIAAYELGEFRLAFPRRKSRSAFALTRGQTAVLHFLDSYTRGARR